MKTTAISLVLTALMVTNAQTTATTSSPTACSSVVDPTNPTFKAIGSVAPLELLSELPDSWVSCIGSMNVNTLLSDVTSAFVVQPTCLEAAPYLLPLVQGGASMGGGDKPKNGTDAGKQGKNGTKDDDIKYAEYESYIFTFPDSDVQKLCTPLTKSIACLKAGIIPAVFKQINGNQCCSAMVAEIKALTGETPDVFLSNLVEKSSDVVCSIQTPGFNGAANQTCGYSWVKSFTQGLTNASKTSMTVLVGRAQTALQIPNDQGCPAVNGNPFKSTTGAATSALFTKPIVPGSCAKSADALLSWVRKFPALANVTYGSIRALDLFEDNKCVKGSDVAAVMDVKYLYNNYGVKPADFNASCFHLSNGGFQTCSFADTTPSLAQNSSATTPAPSKSAASGVAVASIVASSAALMSLTW